MSVESSQLGDSQTPSTTSQHSLYRLGSNGGFLHRGDSLSTWGGKSTGSSESSDEGIKESKTAVYDLSGRIQEEVG